MTHSPSLEERIKTILNNCFRACMHFEPSEAVQSIKALIEEEKGKLYIENNEAILKYAKQIESLEDKLKIAEEAFAEIVSSCEGPTFNCIGLAEKALEKIRSSEGGEG